MKAPFQLADFAPYTVAWILQRYIEEMPTISQAKAVGQTQLYTMWRLQRSPIGAKDARKLTKADIIDHCKARRAGGAQPQTVNQDITCMRTPLKFAGSAWDDCEEVSDAPIVAAMPFMKKYDLVGKGKPRERRPTQDEIDRLLAHYDVQAKHKKTKIRMRDVVEFSLLTARRISETCRLRWGDVNGEDMTCIVRDMKDPKNKVGNHHEFPLIGRAWDIVMAQPRRNPNYPDERIFPFNSRSCSASYTEAKKKLGIENLRLHDNRREAASRFIEGHESFGGEKHSLPEAMVLTGHKTPTILSRTYVKLRAKDLVKKREPEEAAS